MRTVRELSGHFTGHGGLSLFYRVWEPEDTVGSVVIVHGTNEHVGRYEHLAAYLSQRGLAVYALDQRGHGRSEGVRCYVNRFEDYLTDLRRFVEMAQVHGKPIMIGHSLGGLIAYRYALDYADTIRAVVISSPLFQLKVKVNPIQKAFAPVISALLPRLQMPANLKSAHVSRDPDVVKRYIADPLVWKRFTPRWFVECMKAARACLNGSAGTLQVPVLFMQAGDDLLVDPNATRTVHDLVPHQQKTFKLYPGKYHEIYNDPGFEDVFADLWQWMSQLDLVPASTGT